MVGEKRLQQQRAEAFGASGPHPVRAGKRTGVDRVARAGQGSKGRTDAGVLRTLHWGWGRGLLRGKSQVSSRVASIALEDTGAGRGLGPVAVHTQEMGGGVVCTHSRETQHQERNQIHSATPTPPFFDVDV